MVNFHKDLMYKTAQFQNVGSSFVAYKLQRQLPLREDHIHNQTNLQQSVYHTNKDSTRNWFQ